MQPIGDAHVWKGCALSPPPDAPARPDTDALDRLRRAIASDPALQDRLAVIHERDPFTAEVSAVAGELGLAIDPETIAAALVPDPLGLARLSGAGATVENWPRRGWLPTGVAAAEEFVVDWACFDGIPLTAPFFEDASRRARARPINRLMRLRTPLADLASGMRGPLRKPDGLIFHLSRCGSTLVAQMLAAMRDTTVISEAPALDDVVQFIQSRPAMPVEMRVALLRAMAGAFGRSPDGIDGRYFIKLDCWHTLAMPLFRAAFPDTPWIFLYRDPVEVLVSHMRIPGMQTIPGPMSEGIFGISDWRDLPGETYCARVLARVCDGVLDDPAGGMLINYSELPEALETRILPHFGIAAADDDRARIAAAGQRNAKSPGETFTADGAGKRREASDAVKDVAARLLAEPYRRLEALRLA